MPLHAQTHLTEYFTKGFGVGVVAKTAAYQMVHTDCVVLVTTGATGKTITLPPLADAFDSANGQGKLVCVKKVDSGAGAVTVDGSGAETIDGAANVALAAQYDTALLVAGSSEWSLIAPSV